MSWNSNAETGSRSLTRANRPQEDEGDWGRINRRLYITLGATVTDLSLCVIALPFTLQIANHQAALVVRAKPVLLGIICLGLYVWLIAAIVRRPD